MKAFLILLLAIVSQSPPSAKGVWEGTVSLPGQELAFSTTLIQTADAWAGTFDIPMQGAKGLPVGTLSVASASVSFTIPGPGQPTFKLTVAADGKTLAGTLTQGGASFPVKLAWKGDAKPVGEPEIVDGGKLEGIWRGSVPVGGQQIRLVVRFAKSASGTMNGFFSSPDQGPGEVPLSGIGFKNLALQFIIPAIGGSFSGTMSADGTTINGTLSQGISQPLVLKKTGRVGALNRPQEPKRPFPYQEEEVQYSNAAAGIRLAGTLTRPQGQPPFSAAILITGSGAQDRDETILGHKPFLVLSDHLTRIGIAVLRVDDRGVGGSTGNPAIATTTDFAGDVLAAIQFLKSRKEIDARRIGLIGHSEGGAIAPIVASQSSDVAFIVMLAGPGLPGEDILYAQAALIAKASGASDAEIAAQRAVQQSYYAVLKSGEDTQTQERKLRALGNPDPSAIMSPWFRYFLTYDPRPALAKTKCPVLALGGAKDLQVPARENLAAIEAALKSRGNKQYKVVEIPNLNHLFQTSATGMPAEYGTIEETISPVALNLISNWIGQPH
jgi:hypothetical protein